MSTNKEATLPSEEKILIFDTTLRDGEQSAGVRFSLEEKLKIALQLERLGVDVIEAGFPCTSSGDKQAVQEIASSVQKASVCALARAVKKDIQVAWEALRSAVEPRIHVFINSSDIQIAHQLAKSREDVLEQAASMVAYAARLTPNVEFSPMDATRSDRVFLYQLIDRCIQAGATTINIPDSVGYAIPEELAVLFQDIRSQVANIDKVCLSFHGQNDLGLCTANTLTAIQNGVRQVEVTVNGIGERAGNTSLEEVVMSLCTRRDFLAYKTDVDISQIYATSKLVERCSGMPIQWNKAIVGKNAFRHGSGIHQDGILKLRETWEIMDPRALSIPHGTQIVLGKLSGRHAFRDHIKKLGYKNLSKDEEEYAFNKFKILADKKTQVDDRDIEAILKDNFSYLHSPTWTLEYVQVTAGNPVSPTATLHLRDSDGKIWRDAAIGAGPVDAIYCCMNRITGVQAKLSEFSITSVTEGIDAQGEVMISLEYQDKRFIGRHADTDVLVASAHAYMNALNRLLEFRKME